MNVPTVLLSILLITGMISMRVSANTRIRQYLLISWVTFSIGLPGVIALGQILEFSFIPSWFNPMTRYQCAGVALASFGLLLVDKATHILDDKKDILLPQILKVVNAINSDTADTKGWVGEIHTHTVPEEE